MPLAHQKRLTRHTYPDKSDFFLIINILFFQYIISYFGRSRFDQNSIEWLRPHEICQRHNSSLRPKMIVGEADRFDINQGEVYCLTMIILKYLA